MATFLWSRTASLLHCDLGLSLDHPASISLLCSSGPEPEPNTLSAHTLTDMLWLLLAGALISIIITDVHAKFYANWIISEHKLDLHERTVTL